MTRKRDNDYLPYVRSLEADKRTTDLPVPEIMRESAMAALHIHLTGRKPLACRIWACVRHPREDKVPPRWFCALIHSAAFRYLLMAVSPAAANQKFTMQELWEAIAKISSLRLLERLVMKADTVDAAELRRISKDFNDQAEDGRKEQADKARAEEAAREVQEALSPKEEFDEFKDRLQRLPASMRKKVVRQWQLDQLKRQQQMASLMGEADAL